MYDQELVARAQQVSRAALEDLFSVPGAERAVIVRSAAGGGKSYFVATGVEEACGHALRVAVCAPTNEQVFALVRLIATRLPRETVVFVPASDVRLPDAVAALSNVVSAHPTATNGEPIIVGTFDKLGDAFGKGQLAPRDCIFADESFQADAGRYYAVGSLAPTHLLVGDPGQINPFATVEADRWRGLPEDPLQTAVGILLRNHPEMPVYRLPVSRRLDPRAVPVARAFYPDHAFSAAVLPGVRELRLLATAGARGRTAFLDRALELAAQDGWAHVELPDSAVLTADPETIEIIVDLLRRLIERAPQVRCERQDRWTPLMPGRIAVGVSHNNQKDLLRLRLDSVGLSDVVVNTANKLQGAEFDVVIAWHPLAGLPEPDGFHLDPGRMCVLLTRHRHACIVIGRAGDRDLVEGVPPSTPAYLGWDPDPVLDGWGIHQAIFANIERYRLTP